MSDCDDALTNLYQYLDNELEAVSGAEIRLHLEECNGCSRSFDFETRLKKVVRERLQEEVPEEFLLRLRQALAEEKTADI